MATIDKIFILDNGSHTIKANFSPFNDPLSTLFPSPTTNTNTNATASTSALTSKGTKSHKKGASGTKGRKKKAIAIVTNVEPDQEDTPEVDPYEPKIVQNAIARTRDKKVWVGDMIDEITDYGGLVYRRPFERGLLTTWDAQKPIWDRLFSHFRLSSPHPNSNSNSNNNHTDRFSETSLLVTEPYFCPPGMGEAMDQMVFEEWEFGSCLRSCAAALMPYGGLFDAPPATSPTNSLLIDLSYSSTHITPILNSRPLYSHIKRIDLGGKALTNRLKGLLSFRQWDLMGEGRVVERMREECGFVSMDWTGDLEKCRLPKKDNPIVQQYCLPDFTPSNPKGYIKSGPGAIPRPAPDPALDPSANDTGEGKGKGQVPTTGTAPVVEENVVLMGNERFSVPELLFNPSDIGLQQAGLVETIANVIASVPEEVQGMLWANIGVFGGVAATPGFGDRLERDLRTVCPAEYEVGIFEASDPIKPVFYAAQSLTLRPDYLTTYPITRAEYLEHGSERCRRKFISTGMIPDVGNENVVIRRVTNEDGDPRMNNKKGKKRKGWDRPGSEDALSDEGEDVRLPARRD